MKVEVVVAFIGAPAAVLGTVVGSLVFMKLQKDAALGLRETSARKSG